MAVRSGEEALPLSLRTVAARAATGASAEARVGASLSGWRAGFASGSSPCSLPDGTRQAWSRTPERPVGELHIHDTAAAWRMLFNGEMGAGEAYMDGHWSSPDLPALLRLAALNRETLAL